MEQHTITITRHDGALRPWVASTTVESAAGEGVTPREVRASGTTASGALTALLARPSVDRELGKGTERGTVTVQWGSWPEAVLSRHNLFHAHQMRPSCPVCRRYGTRLAVSE